MVEMRVLYQKDNKIHYQCRRCGEEAEQTVEELIAESEEENEEENEEAE